MRKWDFLGSCKIHTCIRTGCTWPNCCQKAIIVRTLLNKNLKNWQIMLVYCLMILTACYAQIFGTSTWDVFCVTGTT